jgi:hypothetical protein
LKQEYVQNLAVVANFLTTEAAWSFLKEFGINFSFAEICSQTFHVYPKFEYTYWFDWVLIVEDIATARTKIKECFGHGWIDSGGDEIWNAKNIDLPTRFHIKIKIDRSGCMYDNSTQN